MRTALTIAAIFGFAVTALAVSERVFHIEFVTPRAAQRGTAVDVTLEGAIIKEAREVLFYRPGIKCTSTKPLPSLPAPRKMGMGGFSEEKVLCRFEIAADCPVGLHPFKVRTPTELTSLSTFAVTAAPIMEEGEGQRDVNGSRATATLVKPGTAVLGSLYDKGSQVADIDCYKISGKAGMRLSIEIDAVRLTEVTYGGAEFDHILRVLDADGRELARNDDNALHLQDPLLSMLLPRDGEYFIEIKQRIYDSRTGDHCFYLAHIGTHSRPLVVYPAGGPAGKPLQATLIGDPTGDIRKTIALPAKEGAFDFYDDMPSPLPMRVSRYGNVLEAATDDTPVPSLPAALNGIIEQPGDADAFRITAKKGERWRVRVFARSLGTPLDPHIAIRRADADTPEIEGDDATLDARSLHGMMGISGGFQCKERLDPSIVWEPKQDGDYVLTIDDMRGLGDATSVYRIEIEPAGDEVVTYFTARAFDDSESTRLTGLTIPQGNRWSVSVHLAEGQGNRYVGEIELVANNLPDGVKMIAPRIPANTKQAQVQFIAAAGAPPQVALISLLAKATDGTPLLSSSQQGFCFLNHSGGRAWNSVVVDQYALAVTDPAPFTIDVIQPEIALSQNGELALAVKITRHAGFKQPIEFQCDWLPPGVNGESTITVPADQSESVMHLHANEFAKPGAYQFALTASTTGGWDYTGVGRVRVASNIIHLNVTEPYVMLTHKPTAVRRGGTTQIEWTVEHKKRFDGEATATLLGLPKGVTVTTPPKLKSGDKTLIFPVTATNEALLGQYKELTCELIITERQQQIHQRTGKGILRVDPAAQ
ncbi:MAG: serine protease [Prosthecobacter sp.]|uniref:serine protease n=1 Tax=Prosthecobacter sp. TaxID=1965333 RepID=UPI00390375EA